MTIPDELTPDDHVVIGGPQGSHRFEIEIEECSHSPGVFVKGLTPPGYTPRVAEAEPPGAYTVKKSGSPKFFVDVPERACTCEDRDNGRWCIHLRVASIYHHRDGGDRDGDDHGGGGGGGENGIPEAEIRREVDRMMRGVDTESMTEEQEAERRKVARSYITGGDE